MSGIETHLPPTADGIIQAQKIACIEDNPWWEEYINWQADTSNRTCSSDTPGRLVAEAVLLAARDRPELFTEDQIWRAKGLLQPK